MKRSRKIFDISLRDTKLLVLRLKMLLSIFKDAVPSIINKIMCFLIMWIKNMQREGDQNQALESVLPVPVYHLPYCISGLVTALNHVSSSVKQRTVCLTQVAVKIKQDTYKAWCLEYSKSSRNVSCCYCCYFFITISKAFCVLLLMIPEKS